MAGRGVHLRRARQEDAEAIVECHQVAIKSKAVDFYDADVLSVWGAVNDALLARVRQEISEPNWIYIVAEHPDVGMLGFGIIIPEKNELRALYVRPNSLGKIGTEILGALLEQARVAGCPHLEADGSLNSESFYIANGFRILSRGVHRFRTGEEMACIKMRIDL